MLNIEKQINGSEATVRLEGRLDTTTAPELENELKSFMESITSLVFDFEKLEYISSAGLRVLMTAHKAMMTCGGKMSVRNPNDIVKGVFEITGMDGVFNIVEV